MKFDKIKEVIRQIVKPAVLAGLVALAAPRPAFAGLQIRTVFIGGTPPAGSLIAGGGDLQEIFQVAAETWESVFQKGGGKWDVTIYYGWTNSLGGQFANERVLAQNTNLVRITSSLVRFSSNPPLQSHPGLLGWFADPTPRDNSEYTLYTSYQAEVEGGLLNVGRVFSEATGDAANRLDLLTIAMHEIGHALGLDDDYLGFQAQLFEGFFIRVRPPRPFAGFVFALTLATGDHIANFGDTPLMVSEPTPGWRQFISGADALLIAQLSSFNHPDLGGPTQ